MKFYQQLCTVTALITISFNVSAENGKRCNAFLSGFQEVPPILTNGKGSFKSKLENGIASLSYTLSFSDLSAPVTVAHIHFGQPGVSGAVIAFLCGGGGKPACPAAGGTVTGTIVAADIIGVPAQGINAGSFSDFLNVLQSGNGYVNVHTTSHPSGEIRGQLSRTYCRL